MPIDGIEDRSSPENARETLAAWKAGRATLKELCAAIEAIFGAATRREEAIGDDLKLGGDGRRVF